MSTLLPCPFCHDHDPKLDDGMDAWWRVECSGCGAHGPVFGSEDCTGDENKASAINGWNLATRSKPPRHMRRATSSK